MKRPTARQALERLGEMRAAVHDPYTNLNRLQLERSVTHKVALIQQLATKIAASGVRMSRLETLLQQTEETYCQTLVITEGQINTFYQLLLYELNSYGWVLQASLFLSSFWAMDFSLLGGDYCISESLNNMNVLLLNFVSVLYPLFLVISTYILIELHARNFRPIVIMWKPFGRCFF